MVYHTGSNYTFGGSARQIIVAESHIYSSTLDMNEQNITSVRSPVRPLDAANKVYVDASVSKVADDIEEQFAGYMVTLTGSQFTEIINMRPGSYLVTVIPYDKGPTATFAISKAAEYETAQISRPSAHPGPVTMEQLELSWPPNSLIRLRKSGINYNGKYLVNFNTRNLSAVPAPPVMPSDIATRDFVESVVTEHMKLKFGGISVILQGIEPQDVIHQRLGSTIISISPVNISGAPTATFSLSKASLTARPHIMAITQHKGQHTPEQLIVDWREDGVIAIHKTGAGYDGCYLVEMSLKNFSSLPQPLIESDAATISYVQSEIEKSMQARFGGQTVYLEDTAFSPVFNMRPGGYLICVSNVVPGGPSAVFSVTKNSQYSEPHIVVVSRSPGLETGEMLEIAWPANSKILLRKTGASYNGHYLVDIPAKNLTVASEVVLESDIASKSYVDKILREILEVKHGGLHVQLTDTLFTAVAGLRAGSYAVAVTAPRLVGAPTANFLISKSKMSVTAHIVKITSCKGEDTNEVLELIWPANERLQLRKTGCHYDGDYRLDFNLKNLTMVEEPVIPTDIVTKEYLNRILDERMDVKFGGIKITLTGTEPATVCAQRCGSYYITVNPTRQDGSPTASFQVSKSASNQEANIVLAGSAPGIGSNTRLHLTWRANEKICIYKSDHEYDGPYIVDFSLKNFSSVEPPLFPSDSVDKAYVDQQISERFNNHFGGTIIQLLGTDPVAIGSNRFGSCFVNINSTLDGSPTATFHLTKASASQEGNVSVSCASPGYETGVRLQARWMPFQRIEIYKNGSSHDGNYIVKFNNPSVLSLPQNPELPSDLVDKAYIDHQLNERFKLHFGGIEVQLDGTKPSVVCSPKPGSYFVTVNPVREDGSPTGSFQISKSAVQQDASVTISGSAPGFNTDVRLYLVWRANEPIKLYKTSEQFSGVYTVNFDIKNLTTGIPVPELPTDLVDKNYVDTAIAEQVKTQFGGIEVRLEGTKRSDVCSLRNGSYVITVNGLLDRSLNGIFHLSRTADSPVATVSLASSSSDSGTNTRLHLEWLVNEPLRLYKDGPDYDDMYVVNFDCKNLAPIPRDNIPLPTDLVDRAFVNEEISKNMRMLTAGTECALEGTERSEIPVYVGSYYITINSLNSSSHPSACFQVSRTIATDPGNIGLSQSSPSSTGTRLHLEWPPGQGLQLFKDRNDDDGIYVVNMGNGGQRTSEVPSGLVDRSYLDSLVTSLSLQRPTTETFTASATPQELRILDSGLYSGLAHNLNTGQTVSFTLAKLPEQQITTNAGPLTFQWYSDNQLFVTCDEDQMGTWMVKIT